MNSRKSSIDGFVPRRPGGQMGEQHIEYGTRFSQPIARKELKSEDDTQNVPLGVPRQGAAIGNADIEDSLRQLDANPNVQYQAPAPAYSSNSGGMSLGLGGSSGKHSKSGRGGKKLSRKERKRIKEQRRTHGQKVRRRISKIIGFLIIAAILGVGGFLAYKTIMASDDVLNGNFIDLIQNEPLKTDENGRSNFILLGTSEDDPGHDAGHLTDSIIVLSIDQEKKDAYMFNIPRDLYVKYDISCLTGNKGKVNVYFSCVDEGTDDAAEQRRLQATQELVGDIVGLDIQYGVHVNYTVMRDVVNAIGGEITVTIDSRDERGVMDSNFDWKCGATYYQRIQNCPPDGHFIQYPNGEVTIDAEHALYLAQARGDTAPTYGFEQSNFDRERNQQMIAVAIRDKALSAGTLTNLGAITGLIDALGGNLRTNIQTNEIRTLMQLAQDIKTENIKSLDFYNEENLIFTTGPIEGAGSSVYPAAGVFNYSELQNFIKKQLTSDPVAKEGPHLIVLNGTTVSGVAQTASAKLEEMGFVVDSIDNAPEGEYGAVEIYQINPEKTASAAKLQEIYDTTTMTTPLPVSTYGETDFVIIIGDPLSVQ